MNITLEDMLKIIPEDEFISIWFGGKKYTMNGKPYLLLDTLNDTALSKRVLSVSSCEDVVLNIILEG